MERQSELGRMIVDEDVLMTLAAEAALAVDGIEGMTSRRISEGLAVLLHKDVQRRGIKLSFDEAGHYAVDAYVLVSFGVQMGIVCRDAARGISEALRDAVEEPPVHVTVHIEGVRR